MPSGLRCKAASHPHRAVVDRQGSTPLQSSGDQGILTGMILKEAIAKDLEPLRNGGITFYPAAKLERIFDWARAAGRELEWVEGVFYRPDTDEGQLSLSYICERDGAEYGLFRQQCLDLTPDMEAEAASKHMSAYFEIGITD